jgi:acylglycerol lipase
MSCFNISLVTYLVLSNFLSLKRLSYSEPHFLRNHHGTLHKAMTTSDTSTSSSLTAAVGGCLAALAFFKIFQSSKKSMAEAHPYELWGKTVNLGIHPKKFPTEEEMRQMESLIPECHHGWFESSYEGKNLHYRKFLPPNDQKPKAIIVYHHGIQAHSGVAWITNDGRKLSLAAQLEHYVTRNGFALYAMDQLGHGYSEGRRMFVPDYKNSVKDLEAFTHLAASEHDESTPLFLSGHSFGGCLCLHVAHAFQTKSSAPPGFRGLLLMAPAIIGDLPPPPVTFVLRHILAPKFPTWTPFFMPNPVSANRIWRDTEVLNLQTDRRYYEMGLESTGNQFSLGTALQLVTGLEDVRNIVIPTLQTPICLVHGSKDNGVPYEGTEFLDKHCPSKDKCIFKIDGAYHDLLADPAMEETISIFLSFISKRIDSKVS